jgi:hypothetical protein
MCGCSPKVVIGDGSFNQKMPLSSCCWNSSALLGNQQDLKHQYVRNKCSGYATLISKDDAVAILESHGSAADIAQLERQHKYINIFVYSFCINMREGGIVIAMKR